MDTHRFTPGKRFEWKGRMYEVKRVLPNDELAIEDLLLGVTTAVSRQTLVLDFWVGELHFAASGEPANTATKDTLDLSDYAAKDIETARYRLSIVETVLDLPVKGRRKAIQTLVDKIRAEQAADERPANAISVAAIYEWIGTYEHGDHDIRALIPNTKSRGGKGESRLAPEVEQIITQVIQEQYLAVQESTTIKKLMREINRRIREANATRSSADQLSPVSWSTVERRLEATDMKARFAAKHGSRAARKAYKQAGQMEYPTIPLERVEIDHTRIDLFGLDPSNPNIVFRLTLSKALDCATRYPLGYYLGPEPAGYSPVFECLYHSILPKFDVQARYGLQHPWRAHGLPLTLVTDNGREFGTLKDACQMLGIKLVYSPVKTPEYKGAIERMMETLNGLFHTLPGTTFSNPFKRGDYKSMKQACLTLDEIDQLLTIFLIDKYAEEFHEGLQAIPAREWERAEAAGHFNPRLPASERDLVIALGRPEQRTIRPSGIEFELLRYNCPELADLRHALSGQRTEDAGRMKFKYNPADLGRIYVFDPFRQVYIEVPALAQDYARGLSLWKHRVVLNYTRQVADRVDEEAVANAQHKIDEIVAQAKKRTRKAGTAARIARYEHSGQTRAAAASVPPTQTPPGAPAETSFSLESELQSLSSAAPAGWRVGFDLRAPSADSSETDDQEASK